MFWYGIFGFVALFIHGLNSVEKYSDRMGSLKMVGGGLVGLSLLEYIPTAEKEMIPGGALGFGILAAVFALLLIYTNVIAADPGAWKRAAKQEKDPDKEVLVRWRAHANLLFSNWLNYFVYQETPYNIEEIE